MKETYNFFPRVYISRCPINFTYKNNIETLPVFGLNIFQNKAKNNNKKEKLDIITDMSCRFLVTLMNIYSCCQFMLSSLAKYNNRR